VDESSDFEMAPKIHPFTCERARGQVSAHADGELSQLETAELRRHLAGCASCREYEAQVGAVSSVLRSAELEQPDFAIFVPRRRQLTRMRLQVGVAAAAMLALVAGASLRGGLAGHELTSTAGLVQASSSRPAYFDSTTYEQRLIEQARDARNRPHMGSAVAT
jgi:predicted anti-sigma-YlaC factor YlaD